MISMRLSCFKNDLCINKSSLVAASLCSATPFEQLEQQRNFGSLRRRKNNFTSVNIGLMMCQQHLLFTKKYFRTSQNFREVILRSISRKLFT